MSVTPQLARFHLLERTGGDLPGIADPGTETVRALQALGLSPEELRGKRIAVAVGSRGVASLSEIVRAACQWLKREGAAPFVFPAMGSHGGATGEGQRRVLEEYGITPEFIGAEIRSSMDVERVGTTPEGFPVFMDRNAWLADRVLVINRIKTHTSFSGSIESGRLKMIAIGMGKREGAEECHRVSSRHGLENVIRSVAGVVLATGKVLAGLGVVENGRHQAAAIRAARAEGMVASEEEMLVLAKSLLPRIPFSHFDLLMVDEMGKDVSGAGMDPKVIGRAAEPDTDHAEPKIKLVYVRSLTKDTAGNALGVGLADLIHERLYRNIDFEKMHINARTSLNSRVARVPMWFRTDREALDFSLRCLGSPEAREQRVLSIRNTLDLDRILISEALAAEARELEGWRLSSQGNHLEFNQEGDLPL